MGALGVVGWVFGSGGVVICALMFSKRLNLFSYACQRCEQGVSKTVRHPTICKDLTQMTA